MNIKWDKNTYARGRNGMMNVSGIVLAEINSDNTIVIHPITGRGNMSFSSYIAIPRTAIPELIAGLTEIAKA